MRSLALYRQALDLRKTLASEPGSSGSDRLSQVRVMLDVGRAHQRIGELESARAAFEEALGIAGQLLPDVDSKRAQAALARCYWNLASVEIDASHPDLALAAHTNGRAIQQKLVDDYPDDVRLKTDLVNTDLSIGYNIMAHMHTPADALVYFERARAMQSRVVAAEPDNPHYLRVFSECDSQIGFVELERGRPVPALAALKRAQHSLRILVEKNPNVTIYQDFLAGDLENMGIAYAKAGEPQESLEAYTAARQILEKLAASDPSDLKYQRDLASAINNIGDLQLGLEKPGDALLAYEQAQKLLEPLVQAHPKADHYQQGMAFSLAGQGRAKLKQAKIAAGVVDLRASSTIWHRLTMSTNESLYVLAENHALVAAMRQVAGSGVSASDAETEAERAVECLRKPLAAGYRTVTELRSDPQFRALEGRSDFQGLLLDALFPRDSFARP
jgi:tetratricopeptide (TPR) repeat protein